MNDQIFIRDLAVDVVIGTNPEERLASQRLLLNLSLTCDLSVPGQSDTLADTVDYFTLYERIVCAAETSRFFLLEALAQELAKIALETDGVISVTVEIEKKAVLPKARAAAVCITRSRVE